MSQLTTEAIERLEKLMNDEDLDADLFASYAPQLLASARELHRIRQSPGLTAEQREDAEWMARNCTPHQRETVAALLAAYDSQAAALAERVNPLAIYDAFTCPNCRGSKVQAPPWSPDDSGPVEPVPCDFCRGDGAVTFAGILERFDNDHRTLAERDAEIATLNRKVGLYRRHDLGGLFCWCVENLDKFPPIEGEWQDEVKRRLIESRGGEHERD